MHNISNTFNYHKNEITKLSIFNLFSQEVMILKNEDIFQTSRVKFKKRPLFDEDAHRLNFYEMVITQKPLFQTDSFSPSTFADPKSTLAKRIAKQLEFRVNQLKEITPNREQNQKRKKEQAEEREEAKGEDKLDTVTSNIAKSGPVGQIQQFYKVVNNKGLEAVHELFEIQKSAINEQLFNLLLEVYCLFQLSKQETSEEFRVFFEIDAKLCFEILFGEDMVESSIFEAVVFKKTEYEGRKESLIRQIIKKNPLLKKITADKLEEFLQICFIEWKSISEDFGSYENNIKRQILELNDPKTIADNIVYDIEENLVENYESYIKKFQEQEITRLGTEWTWHHAKYKEDLRWKNIIGFTREFFKYFISVSSINDYEKYIESHIIIAQDAISDQFDNSLIDLIQVSCKAAKKRRLIYSENDQNYSIKDLLSEEYMNTKLWNIIKNNSNSSFYNLISQKAPVIVNSLKLKIIFVQRTLESRDVKIPESFLSNKEPQVTYVCSLTDEFNVMRVSNENTLPSLIFCGDFQFRNTTPQQFKRSKLTLSKDLKDFIFVISKFFYTVSCEKTETRLFVLIHEAATGGSEKITPKFQNMVRLDILKDVPNPNPIPELNPNSKSNKNMKEIARSEGLRATLGFFSETAGFPLHLAKKDKI